MQFQDAQSAQTLGVNMLRFAFIPLHSVIAISHRPTHLNSTVELSLVWRCELAITSHVCGSLLVHVLCYKSEFHKVIIFAPITRPMPFHAEFHFCCDVYNLLCTVVTNIFNFDTLSFIRSFISSNSRWKKHNTACRQ